MAELQGSTSKPAAAKDPSSGSLRKPGRRVAFEVPPQPHHRSGLSDIDSSIDHLEKGRYRPYCFALCGWSCLALFTLVIILLFTGISYLAFLQSGMPHVNIRSLNVTKLQVDNSQNMDAVIKLGVRISNKNEKLKLLYGPLSFDVSSEDVPLGERTVGGFSQKPQNDTDLNMTMALDNAKVNKDAVDDLKSDMKANEMAFDVFVSGKIGFEFGSLQVITVPFLSSCRQIKQMDVDLGRRPGCEVKMFAFRPSSN